ncbi:hypothetical protein FEM48_Zijuj11G0079700 [Ziziphus jujuba var. spinosa]|uniref:Pentatricopeptide repeat-containing protein n=1 Tax=Ziziphus jujuba var. spinosa TaxID=714518 RepID=A0A978UHR8_ZIZJJ|nr:hypothetical protein FEM48_Zijuj11G0079700 [Ziziphus jujuba var. spinosa]
MKLGCSLTSCLGGTLLLTVLCCLVYVQSGRLSETCQFFEEMPERNIVLRTSMHCGLAGVGRIHEALSLFNAMPNKNIISRNSMIAGLVRNGVLEIARLVFD